jgi:branched-chain amino acid aminotransferase
VVTPIGRVRSVEGEIVMGDGGSGAATMKLRQQLVDIQRGRADDPHGWVHRVS